MALFGLGKKKETACCCAGTTPASVERAEDAKRSSGIKVLGGGCAKCHELEENTKAALASLGLEEPVETQPQTLTAPARTGFTAVEWGGGEVKP